MNTLRQLLALLTFDYQRRSCLRHGGHRYTQHTDPAICVRCGTAPSNGRWW